MRFLRRSLVGLLSLCLTLALLLGAGLKVRDTFQERAAQDARPQTARERQFSVSVTEVTPMTLTPILTSYGQLQPGRAWNSVRLPRGGLWRSIQISKMAVRSKPVM